MSAPKLLDLFCGAGGAAKGYADAGFDVYGVDINAQRHYPYAFHQGDALVVMRRLLAGERIAFTHRDGRVEILGLTDFVAIHASPQCQKFTPMQNMHGNAEGHPDHITPLRPLLDQSALPSVMENVEGAPLRVDLRLCGTMFGLRIAKHRIFELSFPMGFDLLPPCDHDDVYDPWHGPGRTAEKFRQAQGTPWIPMAGGASRKEGRTGDLFNAIPPAFTQYIGGHLLALLNQRAAA